MPHEKKYLKEVKDLKATVSQFTDGDDVLKQLVKNSPALIAALATEAGTDEARAQALALIRSGNVRAAESVLDLPQWYRSFDITAFACGIPNLAVSSHFGEQIVQFIPEVDSHQVRFLLAMEAALKHADERFFLWLAREMRRNNLSLSVKQTSLLAIYATFSEATAAPATQFMQQPWTTDLQIKTAARAALSWFCWMVFVCVTPNAQLRDTWRCGGRFHGMDVKALATPFDVLEAANALQNCAYQYGPLLMKNDCRLFSLSRDGKIIAMIELSSNGRYLVPSQIKGMNNTAPPDEAYRAVYAFLAESDCSGGGDGMPLSGGYEFESAAAMGGRWKALMSPFIELRGHSRELPRQVTPKTMHTFIIELSCLKRFAE
jgi:hypothetical protein